MIDLKQIRETIAMFRSQDTAHMLLSLKAIEELVDGLEKAECDSRVFMREKNKQWQEIKVLQEERARMVALLKVCRKQFRGPEMHGEDCAFSSSEDEDTPNECDCGSIEFYSALDACDDIKPEDA